MKRVEIAAMLDARIGAMVEIEDVRNRSRVTLKLLGSGARGMLILQWEGGIPHPVEFRVRSGCGTGEMKHWKVTEAGRETLGLPRFGSETAFLQAWRSSLAELWKFAGGGGGFARWLVVNVGACR